MLTNLVKLEVKVGEKIFQFLSESDAPIEHVKEAVFQFQKYVGMIEDQIKAQLDKVEADKKAAEAPPADAPAIVHVDEVKPAEQGVIWPTHHEQLGRH